MTPKKSTHGGARENSGGARKGAGRKPAYGEPGVTIPWRVPPKTLERVLAYSAASGRPPGQVIADAVGFLPVDPAKNP